MKLKVKNQKNERGISLISLVITIIVIIILAAAVILSISNNNPIENARKARFLSDLKTMQEEITLHILNEYASGNEEYDPNTDPNIQNILEKYEDYKEKVQVVDGKVVLDSEKITEKEENWAKEIGVTVKEKEKSEIEVGVKAEGSKKVYIDADGDKVTIPIDFAIVPGCDNVSEGLVISDVENDIQNIGNQFVWVPVEVPEGKTFDQTFVRERFGDANWSESNYSEYFPDTNSELEYNAMKASVEKYKGFYIGRYEASDNGTGIAQSKKDQPFNYGIDPGGPLASSDLETIRKTYPDSTTKTEGHVVSTLCYGVQWDATVRWLKKNYPTITEDSSEYGNYIMVKDSTVTPVDLINTGSNSKFMTNNIYDMCGNIMELTMEFSYESGSCVYRGGSYEFKGFERSISSRNTYLDEGSNVVAVGVRLALYIK